MTEAENDFFEAAKKHVEASLARDFHMRSLDRARAGDSLTAHLEADRRYSLSQADAIDSFQKLLEAWEALPEDES